MAQPIKNNEILKAIQGITLLNSYVDKIPSELAEKIQLTADVSPFVNADAFLVEIEAPASWTTNANKDTYVTCIAVDNDDASFGSTTIFNVTFPDGSTSGIVCSSNITINFPGKGLLLKKNTAMTSATTTSGHIHIAGYLTDSRIFQTEGLDTG